MDWGSYWNWNGRNLAYLFQFRISTFERGICYFFIEIESSTKDLHSGVFGGSGKSFCRLSHAVDPSIWITRIETKFDTRSITLKKIYQKKNFVKIVKVVTLGNVINEHDRYESYRTLFNSQTVFDWRKFSIGLNCYLYTSLKIPQSIMFYGALRSFFKCKFILSEQKGL